MAQPAVVEVKWHSANALIQSEVVLDRDMWYG